MPDKEELAKFAGWLTDNFYWEEGRWFEHVDDDEIAYSDEDVAQIYIDEER